MINSTPKLILAIMGGVVVLLVLIGIFGSDPLEVSYDGSLVKIQNVGDEPVEIKGVMINDRTDCAALNVMPQGNILKVGDSMILMPLCEAVRVKITTASGSDTYYLH
jgi:hypothetical protein